MEKKHKCKICNRRFPNGRALGGHMRSHLAKLPVPPQQLKPVCRRSSESSTPSDLSSVPADFDCASETSTPSTNPPPNKRLHAAAASSSVSDTNPEEEDVALCLLMMSRDSWTRRREHDGRGEFKSPKASDVAGAGGRGYRCETCHKTFRSGQALGGHRASHRRTRIGNHGRYVDNVVACGVGDSDGVTGIQHRTIYECPFCFKVFDSGQALGGHKKIHPPASDQNSNNAHDGASVASSAVRHSSSARRPSPKNGFIDLNLPASFGDNNAKDDSGQFADFSVVSQAALNGS